MSRALKLAGIFNRKTLLSNRLIGGVVREASSAKALTTQTQNASTLKKPILQATIAKPLSPFVAAAPTKPNSLFPEYQKRLFSSKSTEENFPKNLGLVLELLEKKNKFELFKELLMMESKDVPPLFFADYTFNIMDLYMLLKSDHLAEGTRELIESSIENGDKDAMNEIERWYSDTAYSSKAGGDFDANVKLFQSIASGQSLKRTLEDLVRSYYLVSSPLTTILIETFVARACCELAANRDVERKIGKMLSHPPFLEHRKTEKIKDIMTMAGNGTALSGAIKNYQEAINENIDPAAEPNPKQLSQARAEYDAFKMAFEFMLKKVNHKQKPYRAIDPQRMHPVVQLYIEHPEILKSTKLMQMSLEAGNFKNFKSDLERIPPDILKKMLNEAPVLLDHPINFTNEAVIAGREFVELLLEKGWDPAIDQRKIAVTPFSSAIIAAIGVSKPDVVEVLLKHNFDKSNSYFLMNKAKDPLDYAVEVLLNVRPDRQENAEKIVKILKSYYQKKPNPSPSTPEAGEPAIEEQKKER